MAAFLERIVAIPTTAGRADICPPATATRLADTVLRFFLPPSWPEKGAAQVVYASGGRIADEGEDVDKGGDAKEAGAENGESESKAESDAVELVLVAMGRRGRKQWEKAHAVKGLQEVQKIIARGDGYLVLGNKKGAGTPRHFK